MDMDTVTALSKDINEIIALIPQQHYAPTEEQREAMIPKYHRKQSGGASKRAAPQAGTAGPKKMRTASESAGSRNGAAKSADPQGDAAKSST